MRFDQRLEACERAIPALRYLIEVSTHFLESFGFELPDRFATDALAAHEPGTGECTQVLRDGLTRDIGCLGQPHDRLRPGIAQAQDDAQTRFIAECREDRRSLRDARLSCRSRAQAGQSSLLGYTHQILLDERHLNAPALFVGSERLGAACERNSIEAGLRD